MSNETMTATERLAVARKAKADREAARQAERDAAELEGLELEERFTAELGPMGRAFVMVDASDLGEGFIVMKLGEDVLWNTFKASKMNVVDVESFVLPCVVHPAKETYRASVQRRAFLAERCTSALASLYGVHAKLEAGKF